MGGGVPVGSVDAGLSGDCAEIIPPKNKTVMATAMIV
jgi:hypothetical protein